MVPAGFAPSACKPSLFSQFQWHLPCLFVGHAAKNNTYPYEEKCDQKDTPDWSACARVHRLGMGTGRGLALNKANQMNYEEIRNRKDGA